MRAGIITAALILISGCSAPPEYLTGTQTQPPEIIQDGVAIPQYPSAADQLNYARSGLTDKKRKMAAFRAVKALFPGDRSACGQAAMGLAYLHLEPQYRVASELDIRQAINEFKDLLTVYKDQPDITAKALWYLGWIHTQLQADPATGMGYYWQVANGFYPIPLKLSHTAPWVNLVYGLEPVKKQPVTPENDWGQVALLEIVRHSPEPAETIKAFHLLIGRSPASQAAGLALKHMLADPNMASQALAPAAAYLALPPSNPYLARDIRTLAEAVGP